MWTFKNYKGEKETWYSESEYNELKELLQEAIKEGKRLQKELDSKA